MSTPPELGPQLAVGRTAEIFAWGQDQVLKLYQDWVPAEDADHEAAMTEGVAALGLPAAHCYGRMDLNGRPGVLFERLAGTLLLDALLGEPARTPEVARTLAQLHVHMHGVNAPALPNLSRRLHRGLERGQMLSPRWRAAALSRLHELPDGERLCHGDFHPGNVLMTKTGPVIIDWIDVASGNPLADVARTLVLVRYGQAPDDPQAAAIIDTLRARFEAAYLAAYRALAPAAEQELSQWLPVMMAARLVEDAGDNQRALLNDLSAAFGLPDG